MKMNLRSVSEAVVNRQVIKKKLICYWISLALLTIFAPVSYFFEDYISNSYLIIAFMFFVMIPVGIMYLSIFFEMNDFFGYKLWVALIPLVFWPRLLATLLAIFPFIYVVYLTIVFNRSS